MQGVERRNGGVGRSSSFTCEPNYVAGARSSPREFRDVPGTPGAPGDRSGKENLDPSDGGISVSPPLDLEPPSTVGDLSWITMRGAVIHEAAADPEDDLEYAVDWWIEELVENIGDWGSSNVVRGGSAARREKHHDQKNSFGKRGYSVSVRPAIVMESVGCEFHGSLRTICASWGIVH